MISLRIVTLCRIIPAIAITTVSTSALACASCGCTLSSDWESQGFTIQPGLKLDVRYDYLNQDQLRHDTGKISAATHSMATDYSAFEGRPVQGRAETVTVRGKVMVRGGEWCGETGWGNFLHRKPKV